jgi:hypothetical protein
MKLLPASWRWRVGLLAAAIVAAWLGRGLALRGLAAPLVSRQSADGATVLVLWGDERGADGGHGFDGAAAFYRQDPSRSIFLIGRRGTRLVELGILSPFATLGQRELAARGVPPSAVETVAATAADQWDQARLLNVWLEAHPGTTVALWCKPLGSGQVRWIIDHAAAPAEAARVRVVVSQSSNPDAPEWWQSRSGVKDFMLSWLELVFTRSCGPRRVVCQPQSVAAYEEALREAYRPRSP